MGSMKRVLENHYTVEEIREMIFDTTCPGWCETCDEVTLPQVEHGSRGYKCPVCDEDTVSGVVGLLTEVF